MKRVLIGMSGGVDSSAAAYLLLKQGYEVIGVTMKMFDSNNETGCAAKQAIADAKKACDHLGIRHYVIDASNDFSEHVIHNFINTYQNACTPNPCIECNRFIKFGIMWEYAKELGCDFIATGHYAKIVDGKLFKINSKKDQTYFLYNISRDILSHILFPLNEYEEKEEIRQITKDAGLDIYSKKDSQDICFINDGYEKFLEEHMEKLPAKGNFVLTDGTILGQHKGIIYYTIGQRKGLGLSYKHPLYVCEINKEKNEVILGDESTIYTKEMILHEINILVDYFPKEAMGKVRYGARLTKCKIEILTNNELKVIFDEPVRSATPGQSCVLYDGDICLGGGKIKKIFYLNEN